ncbi:DUF2092 domain-containing protein [Bauldia litoralis]|uniref:DUF2092 domain-containing protein n=1 Tax=Bauldia litoralis TaxID=665467 RepID=A0A1G6EPM4_9HYPH|nr:DUF2092 domain-containing protein [Bauldia litoralis]SDB59374.1 hypothetical protein SAMN02982931_04792 [Bauldia litoralis]
MQKLIAAFVAAFAGGAVVVAPASADEQDARRIFQEMSDYLGSQSAFSFDYDAALDLVTNEGQTLTLASSGKASVARPDKISASRTGGFAEIEMVFDGKTLTFVNKGADTYTEIEIPGDLDNLIDTLRDTYQRPLPAADLLMSDVDGQLMPLVTDVKDLGSGVVGGVECNHFAFRTQDVDWQIWIAGGDEPYPCRYTISSSKVAGSPQYTLVVSNWKTGADAMVGDFKVTIPAGATKVDASAIADKLPENFTLLGDAK